MSTGRSLLTGQLYTVKGHTAYDNNDKPVDDTWFQIKMKATKQTTGSRAGTYAVELLGVRVRTQVAEDGNGTKIATTADFKKYHGGFQGGEGTIELTWVGADNKNYSHTWEFDLTPTSTGDINAFKNNSVPWYPSVANNGTVSRWFEPAGEKCTLNGGICYVGCTSIGAPRVTNMKITYLSRLRPQGIMGTYQRSLSKDVSLSDEVRKDCGLFSMSSGLSASNITFTPGSDVLTNNFSDVSVRVGVKEYLAELHMVLTPESVSSVTDPSGYQCASFYNIQETVGWELRSLERNYYRIHFYIKKYPFPTDPWETNPFVDHEHFSVILDNRLPIPDLTILSFDYNDAKTHGTLRCRYKSRFAHKSTVRLQWYNPTNTVTPLGGVDNDSGQLVGHTDSTHDITFTNFPLHWDKVYRIDATNERTSVYSFGYRISKTFAVDLGVRPFDVNSSSMSVSSVDGEPVLRATCTFDTGNDPGYQLFAYHYVDGSYYQLSLVPSSKQILSRTSNTITVCWDFYVPSTIKKGSNTFKLQAEDPHTRVTVLAVGCRWNPLIKIHSSDAWKFAIPYVYKSGAWRMCEPNLFTGGQWKDVSYK